MMIKNLDDIEFEINMAALGTSCAVVRFDGRRQPVVVLLHQSLALIKLVCIALCMIAVRDAALGNGFKTNAFRAGDLLRATRQTSVIM